MHERGVCGCPVIFPDLIKPHVILPSNHFKTEQASNRPKSMVNSNVEKGKSKANGKVKTKVSPPKKPLANNLSGSKKKKGPDGPQAKPQTDSQYKKAEIRADKRQTGADPSSGSSPISQRRNQRCQGSQVKVSKVVLQANTCHQ